MKKKIAILGSTGSIGKNLIDIIDKDKKNFEIILLSANKNYLELLRQAKKYKVKKWQPPGTMTKSPRTNVHFLKEANNNMTKYRNLSLLKFRHHY